MKITRHMMLAATAMLGIAPAFAQSAASATDPMQAARQGEVGDIVVTARRRAESVQKVPVAVTAISAQTLADHQIFETSQLPSLAPSLKVESITKQVGSVNFSIRGVGTAVFGGQTESSVGVVIDDVVYARPAMAVFQLFDLERVEVLRGPQGTLFGKNAPAGLVSITTAAPQIGKWGGMVNASLGFANSGTFGLEARTQGSLNIPISETSAARVSAFFTRQDGFTKDIYRDEDLGLTEYGARLKYRWKPTDALTIDLSGDYVREHGPAGSELIRRQDAPGGFFEGVDAAAGITAGPDNVQIASDAPTTFRFQAGGGMGKIAYDVGNGMTITNIAAYRKYRDHGQLDSDLAPIDFANQNEVHKNYRQFSDELRLSSPAGGRFTYQVGAYYLRLKADEFNNYGVDVQPLFAPPPPGYRWTIGASTAQLARTTSVAGFAESQFKILPALNLTTGLRFTHDDVNYRYITSQPNSVISLYTPAIVNLYGRQRVNNLSYRVGLDYTVAPDIMAYVTYSRGYKGPTFDSTTANPVNKEIAKSLELGVKSTLFDRHLRLNIALFSTNFHGYQAQVQDPDVVGRFITLNAGNLRTRGVEVEFNATPFEGLSLNGGVTYNDAKYQKFDGVPCYFGEPSGTSGRNVCLPTGVTDVTGDQLQNASKWNVTFTPRYEHSMLGAVGFIQGDYSYRSTYWLTAVQDPVARIKGYSMFGGSFGVETSDRRGEISFFIRNAFDKRIPTYVLADTLSVLVGDDKKGGNYWQSFGTMSFRTMGVSASYKF
jgi:iron complex outermembrane receptor protein